MYTVAYRKWMSTVMDVSNRPFGFILYLVLSSSKQTLLTWGFVSDISCFFGLLINLGQNNGNIIRYIR